MRYLVISRPKDVFYSLPDERRMVLMEGTISYVDKYRKAGKFKKVHHMPGWNRTMLILEVDSQEEAERIALESPMYQFTDIETYAMVEWDTFLHEFREAYAQLAATR